MRRPGLPLNVTLSAAICAITVVACSPAGASPSGGDQISHPAGATELVLRVSTAGGFVAPGAQVTHVPEVSLYGDGTLITPGAQIDIFPGPAMPNLLVAHVTEAGVQRILRAAAAAGLFGPDRHYDYRGIADAPTTTFTVVAAGVVHTVSAYALGMGADDKNAPDDERYARGLLSAFQQDLSDVRGRLGADLVGPERPYKPNAIRVFASVGDPATAEDQTFVKVLDWALTPGLGSFGEQWTGPNARCGVVSGTDLERVRADLASSTQLTFWRSDGRTWRLDLRPLLPDEQLCPVPS